MVNPVQFQSVCFAICDNFLQQEYYQSLDTVGVVAGRVQREGIALLDNDGQTLKALNQRVIEQSSRSLDIHCVSFENNAISVVCLVAEITAGFGTKIRAATGAFGADLRAEMGGFWVALLLLPAACHCQTEICPKKRRLRLWKANAIEGQAEVLHRLANGLIHRAVALHWQAQELNWKAKSLHLRK
ncbi:hypothetical protein Tco_0467899 [Tanacetum coccineum]